MAASEPKEYTIKTNNLFKAKYGSFEREHPKVLFLNAKAKARPSEKKTNYSTDVKQVRQRFENCVDSYFKGTNDFSDNYLLTFSLSENSMQYGKDSNIKYEVVFKPNIPKELVDYETEASEIQAELSKNLLSIASDCGFYIS